MKAEPAAGGTSGAVGSADRVAGVGAGVLHAPGIRLRRVVFFGLVGMTALMGTVMMARVLHAAGLSGFQVAILPLFLVTFGWIAVSFWTAAAGFLLRMLRRDPLSLQRWPTAVVADVEAAGPEIARPETAVAGAAQSLPHTAVVMPIFNEDPLRVSQGVEAICRSLAATGHATDFGFHLLSDSNDPEIISIEDQTVQRLRAHLPAGISLHYRRRLANTGRKAGNIAEFCGRWGSRYTYMIVLDADSVMEGATLVSLVRVMEANPRAGLVQTLPLPIRQESVFGRLQQFAGALHGPMLATGLAAWQGASGNYWGHNAIVRIRPFIRHCDLPRLAGRPPLGGEILSHDFVEAALLRRAGWEVWLLPDLPGSYEELPGNLIDYARRDRRWVQGNLQHLRLLSTPGLPGISRLHFLFGAVAYLASVFWLLLLLAGTVAVLAVAIGLSGEVHVFGELGPGGAPTHPAPTGLATTLLGVTLSLLFLPRWLGIVLALRDRAAVFGGRVRLVVNGLVEMVFSVLIAPILMAFHAVFVAAVASGRTVAWVAQPRAGRVVGWNESLRRTGGFMLAAIVWGALVAAFAPGYVWWLLPVLGSLLLAPILVRASSRGDLGAWMRRRGWLLTPAEVRPGPVLELLHGLQTSTLMPLSAAPWPAAPFPVAPLSVVPLSAPLPIAALAVQNGGFSGGVGAVPSAASAINESA